MQKNTKGSALIWAIAVIMMLMVVFIGVLSLSHTYYSRSYSLNSRRQAELSAQSVLTDMVSRIESRNIKYTQFIPAHDGERETLQIELPAEMGVWSMRVFFGHRMGKDGRKSYWRCSAHILRKLHV